MKDCAERLASNRLFDGISPPGIEEMLEPDLCILGNYPKQVMIAQQGDSCSSVGFVLSGELIVEQISESGEVMRIQVLTAGEIFSAAQIYAEEPRHRFTLTTATDSRVVFIPFEQVRSMLESNARFMQNFISYLSGRVTLFQEIIRMLSQKDVRSRLCLYLSREAERCGSLSFRLPDSKTGIASVIGVARPSVPRELRRMREEGLISMDGRSLSILKPEVFATRVPPRL